VNPNYETAQLDSTLLTRPHLLDSSARGDSRSPERYAEVYTVNHFLAVEAIVVEPVAGQDRKALGERKQAGK